MDRHESILNTVKNKIGVREEYKPFDDDIIMGINGAFASLNQLGVGPATPFYITDDSTTWSEFTGPAADNAMVMQYVTLKAKIFFNPPDTSYTLNNMVEECNRYEWRLGVEAEKDLLRDGNMTGVYKDE